MTGELDGVGKSYMHSIPLKTIDFPHTGILPT